MTVLSAIVLLSPCLLVTVLLLFFAAMRYIAYRERVEMAEHGIVVSEESLWDRLGQRSPRGVLWAGVITTMCGLALLLGLTTLGIGWWLLGGLIPLFVGLGILFIYFSGGPDRKQGRTEDEREEPPLETTQARSQKDDEQDG